MFYDISATFAGGDAATTMTRLFNEKTAGQDKIEHGSLCLSDQPKSKSYFSADKNLGLGTSGEYRPFIFGTDTAFGLKLAWSGMMAQVPDTIRLGYNRKEFAWAPIFVSKEECTDPDPRITAKKPYKADVTSFLATIDHEGQATSLKDSGFDHLQYFATGKAATNLSLRQEVRQAMLRKIDPELLVAHKYEPDENSSCITTWIKGDKQTNLPKLKSWLARKGLTVSTTAFINTLDYAASRPAAVAELSIPCQ